MTDPTELSDGTKYDLKSIVPCLLLRQVSPLTNLPVSCRLKPSRELAQRIPRDLKSRTRMNRSFEKETWDRASWMTCDDEMEWRYYLSIRRLYWIIVFDECDIPEDDRFYIIHNHPMDGKGEVYRERPIGQEIEHFSDTRCPARFTTLWKVVRKDDVDSALDYLNAELLADFMPHVPKGTLQYRRLQLAFLMHRMARVRVLGKRAASRMNRHCFDTGWFILPVVVIALCVMHFVTSMIIDLSFSGYVFKTALACVLLAAVSAYVSPV